MTDAEAVRQGYERAEDLRRRGNDSQAEKAFREAVELGRTVEDTEALAWAAASASGRGGVLVKFQDPGRHLQHQDQRYDLGLLMRADEFGGLQHEAD